MQEPHIAHTDPGLVGRDELAVQMYVQICHAHSVTPRPADRKFQPEEAVLTFCGAVTTTAAMLLMKKEYFEAIRDGSKTTTLRYWRGQLVRADTTQTIGGLGKVRIESIGQVEMPDLTDADARADGYENLAQLRQALGRLYPPEKRKGRSLYLVRFTYLPEG